MRCFPLSIIYYTKLNKDLKLFSDESEPHYRHCNARNDRNRICAVPAAHKAHLIVDPAIDGINGILAGTRVKVKAVALVRVLHMSTTCILTKSFALNITAFAACILNLRACKR